ncbi:MAG: hypothetical protein VB095_05155 [Anaerovorax sp.]|nr:hypothetical protein [Anaerovorax sp.]
MEKNQKILEKIKDKMWIEKGNIYKRIKYSGKTEKRRLEARK